QATTDVTVQVKASAQGAAEQIQAVSLRQGRAPPIEFQLKMDRPGAQLVTFAVAPVAGEATEQNNQVHRWVKVLSQKVKVAAYAALPGWDFQYMRNALSRTPWVELQAGVLNPLAPRLA